MAKIEVIKRSGMREPFKAEKVRKAVMRAGASEKLAEKVVEKVKRNIYDGITTNEIYNIAFKFLDKERYSIASLYDLKRAIMRLGPAGYSFETYIGEILREHNHRVMVRQILRGMCVEHEIDIISYNGSNGYTLIECKYHNKEGIYTGLKPVLYTYARYLDLCERWESNRDGIRFGSVMLVTNTKFSSKAIQYAKCKGIELLGWRYPKDNGINSLIESKGLYPLTILRKIDPVSKRKFADANIMLIKDLVYMKLEELSMKTNIPENKLRDIVDEAKNIIY